MHFGIIDYGMGNLLSVKNALTAVGANVRVVETGTMLDDVGAIVLPGVGAFGKGMAGLQRRGFSEALARQVTDKKKPFLGICLGLQLLATRGTELGEHKGLAWLGGVVERFRVADDLRVPHIGWNDVQGRGMLFNGIPETASFYFVHSFHFVPDVPDVVSAWSEYGQRFVAAIEHENVCAVQFHPEKSHKHGLALLSNFVKHAQRA